MKGRFGRAALAAGVLLVVAATQAGCCNVFKAPNRCAACAYDNCIVPYASRAGPAPLSAKPRPAEGGAEAQGPFTPVAAMAY